MGRFLTLCALMALSLTHAWAAVALSDDFESPDPGFTWFTAAGTNARLPAADAPRLEGISHPVTGETVMSVAGDGTFSNAHLLFAEGEGQDMSVQAWVFCEGNDGPTTVRGYQAIVARASQQGSLHMVRLAWDPDHSEGSGDGWVKLQAYDGSTWDYLGIDPAQFGATANGYILDGSTWPSGWHLFRLEIVGNQVNAFVDDMETPIATGTLSINLRDGSGGFYVWPESNHEGYYDNFELAIAEPAPTDFDVLILNGTVQADGESPSREVDIGIIDERIASMEDDLSSFTARNVIDASGLLVVPGFIDTHTHADSGGGQFAYLRQGVTTIVVGNCGGSRPPGTLGSVLDAHEGTLGPNLITLIGHNRLRSAVGLSGSTPSTQQIENMRDLIRADMEGGAFGLSTGLNYATGYNSTTEEVIALAQAVGEYGGLYASHMRDEGAGVLTSIQEAIDIGNASGCRVIISHAKCFGPDAWGLADEFAAAVQSASNAGLSVLFDQYPYTASQTTINALIPNWAENNWNDAKTNHRAQLEADTRDLIAGRGGPERIYMTSGPFPRQWLSDVATSLGKSPEIVIIDDVGLGGASAVYHMMIEDDVLRLMQSPLQMVGSDGPTTTHPRGAGTFPRVWGHYGRDLGLLSVRELVNKTSTLASEHLNLHLQQRGRLRPGWFADIAILDWETVDGPATFESPTLKPTGVEWVLVNGTIAIRDTSPQTTNRGHALRFIPPADAPDGLSLN